ncbi:hypothetical protein WJX73_008661 [Symbiochloris irregularis]|uniref:Uncharacterized protein n=1 Tax=Symbiochloris irregularis TaxID=706552 RepID=A0AAW1Q442_9CHLO
MAFLNRVFHFTKTVEFLGERAVEVAAASVAAAFWATKQDVVITRIPHPTKIPQWLEFTLAEKVRLEQSALRNTTAAINNAAPGVEGTPASRSGFLRTHQSASSQGPQVYSGAQQVAQNKTHGTTQAEDSQVEGQCEPGQQLPEGAEGDEEDNPDPAPCCASTFHAAQNITPQLLPTSTAQLEGSNMLSQPLPEGVQRNVEDNSELAPCPSEKESDFTQIDRGIPAQKQCGGPTMDDQMCIEYRGQALTAGDHGKDDEAGQGPSLQMSDASLQSGWQQCSTCCPPGAEATFACGRQGLVDRTAEG